MDEFGREWMKFDDEELTRQYSPSKWVSRCTPDIIMEKHMDILRHRPETFQEVSYSDEGCKTKLDLYGDKKLPPDAPFLLYIHGGYWQALSKEYSGWFAEWMLKEGFGVAAIGYDLAPQAKLPTIIEQIRKATEYMIKRSLRNNSSIFICGHSAGGHLACMMSSYDWSQTVPEYNNNIKGYIPLSGVFDLCPLIKTYVNEPLKMTDTSAWSDSPAAHLDDIAKFNGQTPQLVAVGQYDSPEFKRQSLQYSKSLQSRGISAEYVELPDVDHYNITENLASSQDGLAQKIVQFMRANK